MSRPNLYQAIGGREACRKLSTAFYARVERDPVLRPLFPGKTFKCAIEEFAAFLAQFLGGPAEDSQRRWWLSLHESHRRFKIGPRERDAWMANMVQAMDDVQAGEPMRNQLLAFFEESSAYVVNQGSASPVGSCPAPEIARRWERQTHLDRAVEAIRGGDANRAIELLESAALQDCSPSVQCGLLALMVRQGNAAGLDYVRTRLTADPSLLHEHYAGRTLLHEAAASGDLTIVELLLKLGADPNATDGGSHTPLYSVGNECAAGGGMIARALVEAGSRVDASDGVKRCTALHMAARRGNVEVAGTLLDCGADIEARDSLGHTPLRRAVNCGKTGVASLLVSRGADLHAKDGKGLTPLLTAKTPTMKAALRATPQSA